MRTAKSKACRQWVSLVAIAALACGCLEREETLVIAADGSVRAQHVVDGDAGDFLSGAARYPQHAPFSTQRRDYVDRDGNAKVTVRATAEFARVEDMPTHYGPAGDGLAAEAVQLLSEFTTWERDGRRFYRFERRYQPRAWADYRVFYRRAFDPIDHHIKRADEIWRQPLSERIRDRAGLG